MLHPGRRLLIYLYIQAEPQAKNGDSATVFFQRLPALQLLLCLHKKLPI